jgi:hypothetical protein
VKTSQKPAVQCSELSHGSYEEILLKDMRQNKLKIKLHGEIIEMHKDKTGKS